MFACAILSITFTCLFPVSSHVSASVKKPALQPLDTPQVQDREVEDEKSQKAMEIYKLGEEYSQKGMIDQAIEQYRKALNLNPNLAEAHLNLGWSYALKKADYSIALQETLEAIRLKPDLIVAHRNLWWIYRLLKNYEKALDTLKKIVQLEPKNAINYLNLGDAYVSDTRDFNLAIQSYKKGLELDPNNVYIHRKLGKVYEFDKKYDLAMAEYKKAIKIRPTDPYTFLFLAVTLGKSGKKEEITPLVKDAIKRISKDLPIKNRWDLMLLKFYSGEIKEETLIARAKSIPIHRCQALFYAGLKHIWEGNKTKGKEFLSECLSMGIDALAEYEYSRTELYLLDQEEIKK